MNGIYLHIPFCERKCNYCAFSSFCNLSEKDRYIKHILEEIDEFDSKKLKKNENFTRKSENLYKIDTIYIGGGTPSLLDGNDVEKLLQAVKNKFELQKESEITIECNPNSLTEEKVIAYKNLGINRISLGIQSLQDDQLKFIGRLHDGSQALSSIELACRYFDNVSCDFLIGLPLQECDKFIQDLEKIISMGVKHISTYMLQVEEGTPLEEIVKNKPFILPDDDECVEIYKKTTEFLQKNNFFQYEISNFAKNGYESRHNLKYWNGENYIGFGLSAHLYIDGIRYANASDFEGYYNKRQQFKEALTKEQLIEEHIMLGLRSKIGVDRNYLEKLGYFIEKNENFDEFIEKKIIFIKDKRFYLNPKYYGVSNYIIVKLLQNGW